MTALPAAPGTVMAVWTGSGFFEDAIRTGEALAGKPAVANHVVIITHKDVQGRWIGIEGRPGGVGLADCYAYLNDSRTRSNYDQVRAMAAGRPGWDAELAAFLASCAKSIGVRYDWLGIASDVAADLHLNDLSEAINRVYRWPAGHGLMPGEFVCSSLAAWQYEARGWPHPGAGTERNCQPADWWAFSDKRLWTA